MFGTKYALQNLYIYFSSIFCKNDDEIEPKDVYNLMLLFDVLFYVFLLIGLKLNDNLNIRLCILISLFIQIISFGMLFYFYQKYYIVLASIGLLNIGNGLINLSTIRNCLKYFPENYGTINGFLLSATGICSSSLTILGEFYFINPERRELYKDEKYRKIFEKEDYLYDFRFFLFIIGSVIVVCGIIGFLFNFNYKEELINVDKLIVNEIDECDSKSNNKRSSLVKKNTQKIRINNVICSCQNIRLIFFSFFGLSK